MKYDIDMIRKKLQVSLKNKRYNHTIGVAYTAASLAMRYNVSMEKALVAGLLHDNARFIETPDMIKEAEKLSIEISEDENDNPILLHSKLGVYYASANYGVNDSEILEAIRWHTTGKDNMSMLDKIVYIADYIEPARDKQPGLEEIRHLAFTDIDKCMDRILCDSLAYLNKGDKKIDKMTKIAYDYYHKKAEEAVND